MWLGLQVSAAWNITRPVRESDMSSHHFLMGTCRREFDLALTKMNAGRGFHAVDLGCHDDPMPRACFGCQAIPRRVAQWRRSGIGRAEVFPAGLLRRGPIRTADADPNRPQGRVNPAGG